MPYFCRHFFIVHFYLWQFSINPFNVTFIFSYFYFSGCNFFFICVSGSTLMVINFLVRFCNFIMFLSTARIVFTGNIGCQVLWRCSLRVVLSLPLPRPYKFHWFGISFSVNFLAQWFIAHVVCVNIEFIPMFCTSLVF